MPLYQYECIKCKHETDEFRRIDDRDTDGKCEVCGKRTKKVFVLCNVEVWKPLTLEHVEHTPKTFYTKQQLKDYCREKKYSSGALL